MSTVAYRNSTRLLLKSEDGYIHKIDWHCLIASSAVFRDMIFPEWSEHKDIEEGSAGPHSVSHLVPIEIPAPSIVLTFFVSLMQNNVLGARGVLAVLFESNTTFGGPGGSIKCLAALLQLLNRYSCNCDLHERAIAFFRPTFRHDPWSVFCLAAEYKDEKLAVIVLADFGCIAEEGRTADPAFMHEREVTRVPQDWFMAYYRAYVQGRINSPSGLHHIDWAKAARSFMLAPPGGRAPFSYELAYIEVFPGILQSKRLFI